MKLHLIMPQGLKQHVDTELRKYAQTYSKGNLAEAWRHLERAHILGQGYPWEHTYVHWKMLQFGVRIKSSREVQGQVLRLLVGGVKSFVGMVPVGNTGGANVPPLQPMEIPEDLGVILQEYHALKERIS